MVQYVLNTGRNQYMFIQVRKVFCHWEFILCTKEYLMKTNPNL